MIKLITPPVAEPVTIEEAKAQCKVDGTDDNNFITGLITDARGICEEYTRMSFMEQTWDLILDDKYLDCSINLPRPPISTVTVDDVTTPKLVKVYVCDESGEWAEVDASTYRVDWRSTPGRVILKPGYSWPSHLSTSGFRIRYTAGYPDKDSVPEGLTRAIKELVAYMYANRGDSSGSVTFAGQLGQLPDNVRYKLDPFKVYL